MNERFSCPFNALGGLVGMVSLSLLVSIFGASWKQTAEAQYAPNVPYFNPAQNRPYSTGMPPQNNQQVPIQGNVRQDSAVVHNEVGPENVLIILDASYSMAEPTTRGGESKMASAKRSILEMLRNVPPTTRIGLRTYGTSRNSFTSCTATENIVPISANNRSLIASKLIGVKPTGATPISYAISRALDEDFNGVNGPKTIILVSDGIETCGEDPCNVAVRMQRKGVQVKMNVIGFGLNDYEAQKQLKCVALATKGKFYSANTAAELANSMNDAMTAQTKVQATIMIPKTPQAPASVMTAPAESSGGGYVDKELPAAVPIRPDTR